MLLPWATVLLLPFPALLKMTLGLVLQGRKWKEKAEREMHGLGQWLRVNKHPLQLALLASSPSPPWLWWPVAERLE